MPVVDLSYCMICTKSLDDEFSSCCNYCKEGICYDCSRKLNNEIDELTTKNRKDCNYCTDEHDKFCLGCKEHIKNCVERNIESCKKFKSDLIFKLYDVRNFNDLTYDLVQTKFFKNWGTYICDCNKECHCYESARESIKNKYNVSAFKAYEIYDECIDYCVVICNKCIDPDKHNLNDNFF